MKRNKQALLWKITDAANLQTSYLLGTMHLLDERALCIIEQAKPYLLAAEDFAAETAIGEMNNLSQEITFLPDNQPLDYYFPPKKIAKLKKVIEKVLKIPFEQVRYIHPMFLTVLFSEKIVAPNESFRMDDLLWDFAMGEEKHCIGIETVEEQVAIFKKIPIEQQCKQLWEIATNLSKHSKAHRKMADLYAKEDILALYNHSKKRVGKLRKMLIYDRNEKMANHIFELVHKKSIFISVGAGHLAGQKGIIRILRKKGLKLEAING